MTAASSSPEVGIVIPALDEEAALPALLDDLSKLALPKQVVVVDGGSSDGTVAAARAGGALVLRSRLGRARQMNAGAAFLRSPWLFFLHADSRLGDAALRAAESHLRDHRAGPEPAAACFGLAFDHAHFFYRLIECGQRLREERLELTYGDQGLLVRRDLFFRVGCYPDEPIMEDVILARRLREAGKLVRLEAEITSSERRYEEEGKVRGWVRNAWLISQFMGGAEPSQLAKAYPPRRRLHRVPPRGARRSGPRPAATLLVFAKAPRPGSVKTRLARTLGPEAAAAAYRRMGRLIVDQLAAAPVETVVCFDPPDAEDEVRRWLDPDQRNPGVRYLAQGGGDLGERMSRMFDRAFERGGPAVVVGTDAPAVDAATVARAVEALDSADVVLGPSRDGGYYLMALRERRPELFRSIPWSTSAVLGKSADRARRMGLRTTYLEVECDIDTAEDLTPEVARRLGLPA